MGWDDDIAMNSMDASLANGNAPLDVLGWDSDRHHVARLVGSTRCERKEVAERSCMFEGDGAFPRQPVHRSEDLTPGITGQQVGEFIQRAGADQGELLLDGRFDRKCLRHIVLPQDKKHVMKSVRLSRTTVWLINGQ